MLAASTLHEILAAITSKIAKTFNLVLHGMRVNDVHDDCYAHLVCLVNEFLQLFWSAETAGRSKKVADMIAEGTIVGVLCNGHHLNGIVAVLLDAWQYVVFELDVGADLLSILCHADVALIDEQRVGVGFEVLLFELIRLCRSPNLCRENLGVLVLHHTGCIGRNTLPFSTVPSDFQFEEVTMMHLARLEFDFPVSIVNASHLVCLVLLPAIEVSNEENLGGIGCPFAQHPSF